MNLNQNPIQKYHRFYDQDATNNLTHLKCKKNCMQIVWNELIINDNNINTMDLNAQSLGINYA